VRLRELATLHGDLAKQLAKLEEKTEALAMNHDIFSRNTRNQLREVFEALRQLVTPPDPPKRPIGFFNPEDKGKKTQGYRRRDDIGASREAHLKARACYGSRISYHGPRIGRITCPFAVFLKAASPAGVAAKSNSVCSSSWSETTAYPLGEATTVESIRGQPKSRAWP
jgi:hypothetical protein